MIKAVIFDMDGVIVNSEKYWREAGRPFFSSLVPSGCFEKVFEESVGESLKMIHDSLLKEYGVSISYEEFVSKYDEIAQKIYTELCDLETGLLDLLKRLKDEGVVLALASSSRRAWIKMVLDRFKLNGYFDVCVSAEDVNGNGKPLPDIYLFTADRLALSPTQCLVVEDSKNGVLSAKSAGMCCVGYRGTPGQDLSKADFIIDDYGKFMSLNEVSK